MRQLSWAAAWAGITAFVWYAFGAVPLHIGVSEQLGLTTAQTSSWIFIVWISGAVSTTAASLYFRQPIPITWTIPGLVYLGTLAGRFSFAEARGGQSTCRFAACRIGSIRHRCKDYEMASSSHRDGNVWRKHP